MILSKFFATQADDEVLLRWTKVKGNTCQDTCVERSADDISYERIDLIDGRIVLEMNTTGEEFIISYQYIFPRNMAQAR